MATITAYIRCTRAPNVTKTQFDAAVLAILGSYASVAKGATLEERMLRVPVPEGAVHATLEKLRGVLRQPLPSEISAIDIAVTGCTVTVFESGEVSICNP